MVLVSITISHCNDLYFQSQNYILQQFSIGLESVDTVYLDFNANQSNKNDYDVRIETHAFESLILSGYGELHIESGNFLTYQYPIITNYNGTLQSLTNGNTNSVLEIRNSCDSSTDFGSQISFTNLKSDLSTISSLASINAFRDNNDGTDYSAYMSFTVNNGATNEEAMRITKAGFVGVQMTNPSYELDVNGTINCTDFHVGGRPPPGMWKDNGAYIYYNINGGRVGVGTADYALLQYSDVIII